MTGWPSNREMPNFDFGFDFDGIQERSREFVDPMKSIEMKRKKRHVDEETGWPWTKNGHSDPTALPYKTGHEQHHLLLLWIQIYELWMMDDVWMDDVFEAKSTKLTMLWQMFRYSSQYFSTQTVFTCSGITFWTGAKCFTRMFYHTPPCNVIEYPRHTVK